MKRRLGAAALAAALTLPLASAPSYAQENDPKLGGTGSSVSGDKGWPAPNSSAFAEMSSVEGSSEIYKIDGDLTLEEKWQEVIRIDKILPVIKKIYGLELPEDLEGREAQYDIVNDPKNKVANDVLGSSLTYDAMRDFKFGTTFAVLVSLAVALPLVAGINVLIQNGTIKLPYVANGALIIPGQEQNPIPLPKI